MQLEYLWLLKYIAMKLSGITSGMYPLYMWRCASAHAIFEVLDCNPASSQLIVVNKNQRPSSIRFLRRPLELEASTVLQARVPCELQHHCNRSI